MASKRNQTRYQVRSRRDDSLLFPANAHRTDTTGDRVTALGKPALHAIYDRIRASRDDLLVRLGDRCHRPVAIFQSDPGAGGVGVGRHDAHQPCLYRCTGRVRDMESDRAAGANGQAVGIGG